MASTSDSLPLVGSYTSKHLLLDVFTKMKIFRYWRIDRWFKVSFSLFALKVLGLSVTPPGCQRRGDFRCYQPSPLLLSARWPLGKNMEDVDNVDNAKNVENCGNCPSSSHSQVPAEKKWEPKWISLFDAIFLTMTHFCRMAWTNAVLVGEPPSRLARGRVPHRWPNNFLPLLHILIVASWCC